MEQQSSMFAIATLVMNGNKYIPGAVALGNSLRLFSKAILVCMVTTDVTERQPLIDIFDEVIEVRKISVDTPKMATAGMERVYRSWISDSPTKWNILGLDKFNKVLFMDADMIAIAPLDEIFLLDVPAAMFDSHFVNKYTVDEKYAFETSLNMNNPYGDPQHGDKIAPEKIESVISSSDQVFFPNGGLVLVEPSKFAMNLLMRDVQSLASESTGWGGVDEWVIMMFYHQNGYTWTHISMEYNVAAYHTYQIFGGRTKVLHFVSQNKPWTEKESVIKREYPIHLDTYNTWRKIYQGTYMPTTSKSTSFRNHLESILRPILGSKIGPVLDKYGSLYQQAFTTSTANPASNYELLEAYGDRFLAGQYAWLLIRTPGIVSADQVTKISSHFQNRYSLEQVCDYLKLAPYIITGRGENLNIDTKSDVIEALIAAIAISWQNMYKKGDEAVRAFVFKVWKTIFKIDPARYLILYEDPKTRFKQLTEQLQVNRSLVRTDIRTTPPQEGGGEIIVTVLYNNYPVGIGRASTQGVYRDTAVKAAERLAYIDALEKNSLQLLLNTQTA